MSIKQLAPDTWVEVGYWSLSQNPMDGGSGLTRMRLGEISHWIMERNARGIIIAIKEIKDLTIFPIGQER